MFVKRLSWVMAFSIPLGITLAVAAKLWVGHSAKLHAAQLQAVPPPKWGLHTHKLTPAEIAQRQKGGMRGIPATTGQSGMGYPKLSVDTVGHKVNINAQVQIWDVTGNNRYVWLLRVYPGGVTRTPKNLLQEHHYFEQVFTPPVGETVNPTFNESLELPNGSYRVEVTTYCVPPDFRLDKIERGQDLKYLVTANISNYKMIQIAE
jgi:hypothetical protein